MARFLKYPVSLLLLATASCGFLRRENDAVTQSGETPREYLSGESPEDTVDLFPEVSKEVEEDLSRIPDDGLLEQLENIRAIMAGFEELEYWKPYVSEYGDGVFHITGNFFGDRDDDLAILILHEDDSVPKRYEDCVKICIINKGEYGIRYVTFDDGEDFRDGCGFGWIGEFRTVEAGQPLWSNYEDDFRSFDEVPEDEIVYLTHDAIFAHVAEACGGGFIFWKDGRFNWLQQE